MASIATPVFLCMLGKISSLFSRLLTFLKKKIFLKKNSFRNTIRVSNGEKAGCFAIIVLQMYCNYKCSVILPHGAVGWSAVGGCGMS